MSKLIDLYKSILLYCGMKADSNGYIDVVMGKKKEPAMIGTSRMVLPTPDHQRNLDPKEKILFHPLTENILRGESEVITKLVLAINIKLNYTIGIVAQSLLSIVSSPELHSKLNMEQMELIVKIKDGDEKTLTTFISIMVNGIKNKPDKLFTNIYIKRGGYIGGTRYSRAAITSFPMYKGLLNDEFDKLRKKDKETYLQLFQYIFPNIDNEETYSFGSTNQIAPNLDSLLRGSAKIASALNDVILTYKEFITDYEDVMFDSTWIDVFDNIGDLAAEIRQIPVQQGNDGVVEKPQPVAQPVALQQPAYPFMQNPQMPQQMQQPMMQRPEPKITKNGISFDSVLQANPALAYQAAPMGPMGMMGQPMMNNAAMAAANRPPAWAAPNIPMGYAQPQMPMGGPWGPQMQPMMNPQMQQPQWAQPQMNQPQMGQPFQMPDGRFAVMTPQGPMLIPPPQQNGWPGQV